MSIGTQLKQHRNEKGYSQQEIIRQLGISRQTLSAWENDRSLPDIISLIRLSDIYEVTIDELVQSEKTDDNTREWISDTGYSFIRYNQKTYENRIPQVFDPYFNIIEINDTGMTITKYANTMTKRYQISDPLYIPYEDISFVRLLVYRRLTSAVRRKILPVAHYSFALQIHLKRRLIIRFELGAEYELKQVFDTIRTHVPFEDTLDIFDHFQSEEQFNQRSQESDPIAFQLWANRNYETWAREYDLPTLRFSSKGAFHKGNHITIIDPKEIPLTSEEMENLTGPRKKRIFLYILVVGWIILIIALGIRACV